MLGIRHTANEYESTAVVDSKSVTLTPGSTFASEDVCLLDQDDNRIGSCHFAMGSQSPITTLSTTALIVLKTFSCLYTTLLLGWVGVVL